MGANNAPGVRIPHPPQNLWGCFGFDFIDDAIKNGGNVALNGLKKTGTFIAEKTAPGREKIAEGASKIGEGVSNAFNTVKSKIVKKAIDESGGDVSEGDYEKPDSTGSSFFRWLYTDFIEEYYSEYMPEDSDKKDRSPAGKGILSSGVE